MKQNKTMINFRSHGEELDNIKSGKLKQIRRKIDWYNPVFKEIEKMNGRVALGHSYSIIYIRGDNRSIEESGKITKVYYKDGDVIIEWK